MKVGSENGRDMSKFDNILYHHINVNNDKTEALADSKTFLDLYYSADYGKAGLESWLTYGPPKDCIAHLKRFKAHGCRRITFRISTMRDPMAPIPPGRSRTSCRSFETGGLETVLGGG